MWLLIHARIRINSCLKNGSYDIQYINLMAFWNKHILSRRVILRNGGEGGWGGVGGYIMAGHAIEVVKDITLLF